jgi:hypothetical protein
MAGQKIARKPTEGSNRENRVILKNKSYMLGQAVDKLKEICKLQNILREINRYKIRDIEAWG